MIIDTIQNKATLYEIIEMNYKSKKHYEDGTHQNMTTTKVVAVSQLDLFEAIHDVARSGGFEVIDSDDDSITCENSKGNYKTYTATVEESKIEKIILGLNFPSK